MGVAKRSAYEWILVTIVIVLTVVLGVGLYSGRDKVAKSKLLIQELAMLRNGAAHYKMINKHPPSSLKELATANYDFGGKQKGFLESPPLSDNGQIVDPFGNPYGYDPKKGWINSTTRGFEKW